MAEMLKRQYDIFALKLELELLTGVNGEFETLVHCTVEGSAGGHIEQFDHWTNTLDELNLPERLYRQAQAVQQYEGDLPPAFIERVLAGLERRENTSAPLWIHLAASSGYLLCVPWERLLHPHVQLPILRLPEFLVGPPRRLPRPLRVALCAGVRTRGTSWDPTMLLPEMVRQIATALDGRVQLELFVEASMTSAVRAAIERAGVAAVSVMVHEPDEGTRQSQQPQTAERRAGSVARLDNAWLLWMRRALESTSVDVVHFIGHGFISGSAPAICLSHSPLDGDTQWARPIGVAEIGAFSTQVGAWSTTLSSAPDNPSPMGLCAFAHHVAQSRPGPLVHHDLQHDPDLSALRDVYAFLYASPPAPPPSSRALIVYCHPARVADAPQELLRTFSAVPADVDQAADALCETSFTETSALGDDVPAWVSAASRFVEKRALQLKESNQRLGAPDPAKSAHVHETDQVRETLERIQKVIARAARDPGTKGTA
jgi:hypothetical protein